MKCQTGLKRFFSAIVTGFEPLFSLMESAILIKQPLCAQKVGIPGKSLLPLMMKTRKRNICTYPYSFKKP